MYKIIGANQVEYGPVNADQLRQWIAEGRVNAQTLVQAVGETTWKPLSSFPEFAANLPGARVSPPPGQAAPPTPPPLGAPLSPDAGRSRALDEINGPAIGMIVTGALGISAAALGIVGNLIGLATGRSQFEQFQNLPQFQGQNQEVLHLFQRLSGVGGIMVDFVQIAVAVFIIYGGLKMKRLENHGLCTAASIIAFIPCLSPCCCIGIPIGIWALVMLNKPEVRSYFS